MIEKLVVLGEEITLPNPMSEEDAKERLTSIIRDVKPELIEQLELIPHETRTQNNSLIVVRTDATFG